MVFQSLRNYFKYNKWVKAGKPVPTPHCVKEKAVKKYAQRYNLQTFIETGTYLGDMVNAVKNSFNNTYSIELQQALHAKAAKRFSRHNHIQIIHGDSSIELNKLLKNIDEPCLFWLDGHYSSGETAKGKKETPILEELIHIFNHKNKEHVILIDDAREFVGKNDYPTLGELKAFVMDKRPDYSFEVTDDIICLTL